MAKTLELAIWDYDGVIVDSFPQVHHAYGAICRELGVKYERNLDKFRKEYMHAKNHINFLLNLGIEQENHAQADVIFKREFVKLQPVFFDGIEEVLRRMSDSMKMALISSNHTTEIIAKLAKINILHAFEDIFGCQIDGEYFSKTEPMKEAIGKFCSSPDYALVIGDRDMDYFHAREAGIPAENIILVDYGWGYDRKRMQEEGYCLKTKVDAPYKIVNALREIENR